MLYNEQKIALETVDEIYTQLSKLFDRKLCEICDSNAELIKQNKFEISLFSRFDDLTNYYKDMTRILRIITAQIKSEPIENDYENLDEKGVK